jgi:hypothetical protein
MIYLKSILNEILQEAPIGTYSYSSETDADSFSTTDKHLVSTDHNIKKIKNFFSKTPYVFNLYFINKKTSNPEIKKFLNDFNYGIADQDLLQKLNINVKPSKNAITVVFLSNYGTNLVPLTPWIIAHRISHAIFGNDYNTTEKKAHNEKIEEYVLLNTNKINNNLSSCIGFWYKTQPDGYEWLISNSAPIEELYKEFFTFKSARTENLTSSGEIYHELFAQYIKSGTISFHFPESFVFKNKTFVAMESMKNNLKKEEIKTIETFNNLYSEILKFSLGKTFII